MCVGGCCHSDPVTATRPASAPPGEGRLGLAPATALYVAAVLGTGILVLPGLAADAAGPASLLAVAAVLLLSVPLAGTFAAVAARHPDAGGVARVVQLTLGPTAARVTGYLFFFGVQFGSPVVALLGAGYVAAALGLAADAVLPLGLAFLVVPIGVAAFGLRVSGAVQLGLSALLVAVVVGVLVVALPASDPANFEPFLPHGWAGVGLAISLFVWAFAGWEAVTHLASEFRDPLRTIPRATALALAIVGGSYLALQAVTVLVLGADRSSGDAPLLDLVAVQAPDAGPLVVGGIAAIVALGVLNTYVPAFAELAAALARDGHLPRWFARGSEAGEVPRRALLLTATVSLAYFAVFAIARLELTDYILIHTSSMVVVYLLGTIGAARLLERGTPGWIMAVISVALSAGLLVLPGANLLGPAIVTAVAVAVTVIRRLLARVR